MTEIRNEHCPIHGGYNSRRNRETGKWARCWGCVDAEIKELEAMERQQAQAAEGEKLLARMIEESGMEGRMLLSSFENYTAAKQAQANVLAACRAFAESAELDGGKNIWLIGPPGTGKTHLGSAMVGHFIRARGIPAAIYSAREIVRMLRASWDRKYDPEVETESQVIDRLGEIGLLVLDEVGVGFRSDAERIQLLDVIDRRYKLGRPTVVLSNLRADDVKEVLGVRAFDRLRDGAEMHICNWESHRKGAQ
ncbi:DNA replication protein DnaC [Comamonas odontotermitis]|uniref:DNA replication protein DnaC n=1 Tax=Comamonas odontotermitis TaxID=379895 RepID=A0ABR6RFP7_9BURK|nr:ATP-binding protein [Comamonas odontotermitis]MBB6577986.1 DNA replication protein DnaC [Comamonas odontotermitis]